MDGPLPSPQDNLLFFYLLMIFLLYSEVILLHPHPANVLISPLDSPTFLTFSGLPICYRHYRRSNKHRNCQVWGGKNVSPVTGDKADID